MRGEALCLLSFVGLIRLLETDELLYRRRPVPMLVITPEVYVKVLYVLCVCDYGIQKHKRQVARRVHSSAFTISQNHSSRS